jgi:hypothetical protein
VRVEKLEVILNVITTEPYLSLPFSGRIGGSIFRRIKMLKQIKILMILITILMIFSVSAFADTTIHIDYPKNNQYLIQGTNVSVRASVYDDQNGQIRSGIQWFYDNARLNGDSDTKSIILNTVAAGDTETHIVKAVYNNRNTDINIHIYNQPIIEKAVNYIKSLQTSAGSFGGYDGNCYLTASLGQSGVDVRNFKTGTSTYVDYLKTLTIDENTSTGELTKLIFTLTSIGEDPTNFNGKNIVKLLLDKQQSNGSFGAGAFTDAFAVISLNKAGVVIPKQAELRAYFEGLTYENGIYKGAYGTDIDTTARIVRALKILGCDNQNSVIQNALTAIRNAQDAEGVIQSWGTANYDTSSEVVMMLSELGINPTQGVWNKNGKTLISAIVSNQDADGSFKNGYDKKYSSYEALLALTQYYFTFNTPINNQTSHSNNNSNNVSAENLGDIRVGVSVIGKDGEVLYPKANKSLKNSDTFGQTALQALVATGLTYKTKNDNAYISEIAGVKESVSSTAGWKYKVNGTTPSASAKNYTLKDDDNVVWFWVETFTQDKPSLSDEKPSPKEIQALPKLTEKEGQKVIFNDVKGNNYDWAREQIEFISSKGIAAGTGAGNFEPARKVTREEFTKMVVSMLGIRADDVQKTQFDDDSSISSWAKGYIKKAKELGIINGYDGNSIKPRQAITREEMAVILIRALQQQKKIKLVEDINDLRFTDTKTISSWARNYMTTAVNYELIKGQPGNVLESKSSATRAETAVVIFRAFQL